MSNKLIAAGLCAGLALPATAHADQASDLAEVKSQMIQMQKDYAARMAALEKRLAKAEAAAKAAKESAVAANQSAVTAQATAKTAAVAADTATKSATVAQTTAQTAAQTADTANNAVQQVASAPPPTPPASNNAFNPGIAAVLNGFYMAAPHDPSTLHTPGFALGPDAGGPPRGFSLGESEISFAANIDPYMSGFLDISFDNANQPSVEEAYILSKDLPGGFTLKGGRFLSGIGYINERHAHDWLFSDAPLPYRAFLGTQYGDDGLQVRWLAPTDQFLEFGAEAFRGDAYPAAGARNNGAGTYTAFVHTGNDINDSSSYLAAASFLHANADKRDTDGHLFSGSDDLGILSLVYKWAPGGNPTSRNFTATSEFFYGREAGLFDNHAFGQNRWGWYIQGDYQFMPRWSAGLRYSALGSDAVPLLLLKGSVLDNFGHMPQAETALVEFDSSEFGRFRVQYTHDDSSLMSNDELLFQYTVIYGPHGAHRY